jgi:hypothetical protein
MPQTCRFSQKLIFSSHFPAELNYAFRTAKRNVIYTFEVKNQNKKVFKKKLVSRKIIICFFVDFSSCALAFNSGTHISRAHTTNKKSGIWFPNIGRVSPEYIHTVTLSLAGAGTHILGGAGSCEEFLRLLHSALMRDSTLAGWFSYFGLRRQEMRFVGGWGAHSCLRHLISHVRRNKK